MYTKLITLFLCFAILLSGCYVFDGDYVRVVPHEKNVQEDIKPLNIVNYMQLRTALTVLVSQHVESQVINISGFNMDKMNIIMDDACRYVMEKDAIGAYALEDVHYEIGTVGDTNAVALDFQYRHSKNELSNVIPITGTDEVKQQFLRTLSDVDSHVCMLFTNYNNEDFEQIIQDISRKYPQYVMECPRVSVDIYGQGKSVIADISFQYESSRESLRSMQFQVKPVFDSAALYVSGNGSERQKYSQLYSFLMERFDYTIQTSITPAYSLLCHGVGDSKAFASIFSAMCNNAGLTCFTVTGTRAGDPWTWNIISVDDIYYHIDLLKCSQNNKFILRSDSEMWEYVWDYSSYPACSIDNTEETVQVS